MAEAARTYQVEPSTPKVIRPPLEVVHDGDPARSSGEEPNVGRNAMIGAAVGFLVVTVAITTAGTLGGIGFGASLGLGAFVGMWGGTGFGFMMGGTIPLARHLDARPIHHGQGDDR